MTIGKKLYAGFGLILGILLLLFFVNLFAGWMEKSARTNAGTALESVRTIESVRYQIMLNRLNMNNFLLSGDPRDEDRVTRGLNDITDIIKRHQVDSGDATVSDLQIFYLQKDPASWLTKSSVVLDQSNTDITKFLQDSTNSANRATAFSAVATILGTLIALALGAVVAFYTAKSISERKRDQCSQDRG